MRQHMRIQAILQNTHRCGTQLTTLHALVFLRQELLGQHVKTVVSHGPLRQNRLGHGRVLAPDASRRRGRFCFMGQMLGRKVGLDVFIVIYKYIVVNLYMAKV